MIGSRFGLLTVIAAAENGGSHKRWLCRCDCGNESVVWQLSLRRGSTTSCGCEKARLQKERWSKGRLEGFWQRVERGSSKDCWPWIGYAPKGPKNATPYGVLGFNGKLERAHRVAFELAVAPIPPGKFVLHKCDNTLCCNPRHLYLGTHAQNMRDVIKRGRRKGINAGSANGRAKLTQKQADRIRKIYAAGKRSQQSIADEYGVCQYAVSAIVRGKRYVARP